MQIRQGDVMFESIDKVPAGFQFQSNNTIVAHGEVTGHCHEIVLDDSEMSVEMFVGKNGEIVYKLPCPALLKHQEHGAIRLPEGVFFYTHQREYSPEEIRNVKD